MARVRSPNTLDAIVDAATRVFIAHGYRLAGVADIAAEADVSAGTLYLYAENKAALFELAVRRAFRDPGVAAVKLPYRAASPEAPVETAWRHLLRVGRFPALEEALAVARPGDPTAEFDGVVREVYRVATRNRRGVKLLEKCASDWPELHAYYFRGFREDLIQKLARWVQMRIESGVFAPVPDPWVAARALLELIAWFAIHRFNPQDTSQIPEPAAEETVVALLARAFLT